MLNRLKIPLVTLLIPMMLLCWGPVSSLQAQQADLNPVTVNQDDDKTDDYILIGLFAVVLGILIVLGIKTDRERSRVELDEKYGAYAMGAKEDPAPMELTPDGVRVRF